MSHSSDYPDVPEWEENPSGYQTGAVAKYKGNIFRAAFWASEPGVGDPNKNGWRFFDELYDQNPHKPTERANIIAYIPTWRKKEQFDYGKGEMYRYITHGIIAFLTFSEKDSGAFDPESVREMDAILPDVLMAARLYGTKTMIALGGANDYAFLDLMTAIGNDPASPKLDQTVRNVVDYVTHNSLDGVDLDLECWWGRPGEQDQGGRTKSDGPHPAGRGLALFAKKLKEAMPDKIVSAAVFGTSWYGNNYDPDMAEHLDWLGVMTYDLTGSWDKSPVGPHSALYKIRGKDTAELREADVYLESYLREQQGPWPGAGAGTSGDDALEDNPILSVEDCLWYWTNPLFLNWQGKGQGVDRGKIAAGVPVYGYDFAAAKDPDDLTGDVPPGYKVLRYKEILDQFPDALQAKDANIKVDGSTPRPKLAQPLPPGEYPYAHNIYFETPGTAVAKLEFLKGVGAKGVIIWELSNDVWEDGKSIIKALYHASGNPVPETSPVKDPPVPVARTYLWDSRGLLGHAKGPLQFQDDGTQDNGMRQFSARLWNIPDDADWKSVAQNCPAVIKRQYFNRPTRIVDKGASGLWGEFDVLDNDDVPDWFWGHMDEEDGAPDGYTRYASRLWGLSMSDDWKEAAKQTPALVAGQYFDQPTKIEDKGVGGLWGIFDVRNEPSPIPAFTATAKGDNDCIYCLVDTLPSLDGLDNVERFNLTNTMAIGENAPFLYSVITKDDDSVDFPEGVVMTIKDPDGNTYDKAIDEDGAFVKMSGDSVRCLIVKDPRAGDWTMSMSVARDAKFRCECNTVPSADVFATMLATRRKLHELQGLEPRDSVWIGTAACVGLGVLAFLAPQVTLVGVLLMTATGVSLVGLKYMGPSTGKTGLAQKLAQAGGIVEYVAKDFLKEGPSILDKYYWLGTKNISKSERRIAREHRDKIIPWLLTHKDVYSVTVHMENAEMQNSIRHVYWQCLLKKRTGEEFAKMMAAAHEADLPGTDADNKADEENNKIGLRLADEVASEEECLDRVKEMWEAGDLATRAKFEKKPA
ncbi:glycoside hydrolase family 18 protein [Streptomyces coffeae]|uniref:chitinase n=1 Tax=Streptomyces coffeae TaxID=621382 RepID=A0ABS1NKE4_9ACTN|nr:glycoside hydrolase family 18 protein [Streptomyces coffeae]MBL1100581.1 glycoside hydrolase family 18 protein [Streptomyces coffeae]